MSKTYLVDNVGLVMGWIDMGRVTMGWVYLDSR